MLMFSVLGFPFGTFRFILKINTTNYLRELRDNLKVYFSFCHKLELRKWLSEIVVKQLFWSLFFFLFVGTSIVSNSSSFYAPNFCISNRHAGMKLYEVVIAMHLYFNISTKQHVFMCFAYLVLAHLHRCFHCIIEFRARLIDFTWFK